MKCNKCSLCRTSTAGKYSLVKLDGFGNSKADIMIVGEAPGYNEIVEREPFVGKAGKLLTKYLTECGFKRKDLFITNIVKCRPPQNRTPMDDEIKACSPYLVEEIEKVKPKVICLLGNTPLSFFLKAKGITKLRGKPIWSETYNCWILPTYHPSYLLRFNKYSKQYDEFKQDLNQLRVLSSKKQIEEKQETVYKVANTVDKARKAVDFLLKQKEFSFDTETSSLLFYKGKILCLSFSWKEGYAVVIPFQDERVFDEQEQESIGKELKRLFIGDQNKIAQNGKFDIKFLLYNKIKIRKFYFDTMLASYLLNEEGIHNLASLVLTYTNMGKFKDEAREYIRGKVNIPCQVKQQLKEKDRQARFFADEVKGVYKTSYRKSNIYDLSLEKLYQYSAKDADATFRVYKKQKVLIEEENLSFLLYKILIPTTVVLSYMELRGINIDEEYLEAIDSRYKNKIKVLLQELYETKEVMKYLAKYRELSFDSPVQLKRLLFEIMDLTPVKYNKLTKTQRLEGKKKGSPSTDKEALNLLFKTSKNKLLKEILGYRKLQKFYNTYIEAYLKIARNSDDKKIHTTYNFCSEEKDEGGKGTVTGRLSSSKPNLQNIPKRDEKEANIIRQALVASKDGILIEADFKQIEFRVFAHYTKDKKLLQVAREQDIHTNMASKIFKIDEEDVTKLQRSLAKSAVFGGIMYGGGSHVVVREFGIEYSEADKIIEGFFDEFPGASKYIVNEKKFAKENGYVVNMFGRRRRLVDLYSRDIDKKEAAYRQAINAKIQSTAADIVYISMIKLHKALKDKPCKLLLNIHDAIVFDCRRDKLKEIIPIIRDTMDNCVTLSVPLGVDVEVGRSLGEMKKFK